MNTAIFPYVDVETRQLLNQNICDALKVLAKKTKLEFLISGKGVVDVNLEEGYSTEGFVPIYHKGKPTTSLLHVIALQEGEGTGNFDSFKEQDFVFLNDDLKNEIPHYPAMIPIDYTSFNAVYAIPLFISHGNRKRRFGFDMNLTNSVVEEGKRFLDETRLSNNFRREGIQNFISPVKGAEPLDMEVIKLVGKDDKGGGVLLENFAVYFPQFNPIFGPESIIDRYVPNVASPRKQRFQCVAFYFSYEGEKDVIDKALSKIARPYYDFVSTESESL